MEPTKKKILSATVGFLKDNTNYEQLTLSKIAFAAEIGKSTVYDYFSSKEELVEETSMYLLEYYNKIVFEEINQSTFTNTFLEQIQRIIHVTKDVRLITDAIFNYHIENLSSFCTPRIEKAIEGFKKQLIIRIKQIFELAYKENLIKKQNDDKEKEYVILAIITGLIYQYNNNIINMNEKDLIKLIEKNCLIILNS